jgi:MurNAc alpha-1-phosphate uridylyltransferase
MLLAAGLGTRLRPLTDHTPKALVQVGGKPLIDYNLAHFSAFGCTRIVVNSHHHAAQLTAHMAALGCAPLVHISHEPVLLESGGGIVQALPLLGDAPFFSANADAFWIDGAEPALARLEAAFDPERMDALLLLVEPARAIGYSGAGDFDLTREGQLSRGARRYIFSGLQLLHPRLFEGYQAASFSLREIYQRAQQSDASLQRMYGLVHDGDWVHVGSPDELASAQRYLAEGAAALPDRAELK